MKTVIVRYRVNEAYARENEQKIHAVFDELRARATPGVTYATYRAADASFVHVATSTGPENPITTLPAFKVFQAALKEQLLEGPVVSELVAVDRYSAA